MNDYKEYEDKPLINVKALQEWENNFIKQLIIISDYDCGYCYSVYYDGVIHDCKEIEEMTDKSPHKRIYELYCHDKIEQIMKEFQKDSVIICDGMMWIYQQDGDKIKCLTTKAMGEGNEGEGNEREPERN